MNRLLGIPSLLNWEKLAEVVPGTLALHETAK